jgi:ElaA protein
MNVLMQKAAALGAVEVHVGAQRRSEGFYASLGFAPCGPEYDDEGVPHVPMKAAAGTGCQCRAGACGD